MISELETVVTLGVGDAAGGDGLVCCFFVFAMAFGAAGGDIDAGLVNGFFLVDGGVTGGAAGGAAGGVAGSAAGAEGGADDAAGGRDVVSCSSETPLSDPSDTADARVVFVRLFDGHESYPWPFFFRPRVADRVEILLTTLGVGFSVVVPRNLAANMSHIVSRLGLEMESILSRNRSRW